MRAFRSLIPLFLLAAPAVGFASTGAEPASDSRSLASGQDSESARRELEKRLSSLEFDRRIDSASAAVELATLTAMWLEAALELRIEKPIELRFHRRLSGAITDDSPILGAIEEEAGGGVITVKSGMTIRRLLQVLAHELVHAWQAENCPRGQRFEDYEGFAQWGAGELLKAVGLEDDFQSLAEREDLYGEAYRWIASIERREGRDGLLRHVRTAR